MVPAWMIEKLKQEEEEWKRNELERDNQRPRVYIEEPRPLPPAYKKPNYTNSWSA